MDGSSEFLNPSSMLTPGLAGGMTMAITNSLSGQFALVAPGPAYVGLGLSFLFGMLVWVNQEISRVRRMVLYVLNSLVIFVVAVGSNTVGTSAGASAAATTAAIGERLTDMLVSNAQAQAKPEPGWCCKEGQVGPASREQCAKASGRFEPKEAAARAACTPAKAAPAPAPAAQNPFFRAWIAAPKQ